MHELSVALEVCRMVEERLGAGEAPQLRRVGLVVGDESGLEAANLSFCLDALLGQPPFGAAQSVITRSPGDDLRLDFYEVDNGNPDD